MMHLRGKLKVLVVDAPETTLTYEGKGLMLHIINKYKFWIFRYGFISVVSFLIFHLEIIQLEANIFLLLETIIIGLTFVLILRPQNADTLIKNFFVGLSITAGYFFARIYMGSSINNIWLCNTDDGKHCTRKVLILLLITEYFFLILFAYIGLRKKYNKNTKSENDLFRERLNDLERLESYLSEFSVVGVNGIWGSGKTYLVDEYYNRHITEFHLIKVYPLVCNLDQIDLFIFQRLEEVLWAESIYPRYSKKIRDVILSSNWLRNISNISSNVSMDNTTAFEGFCQDLDKLEKPILLVFEDIDRISEDNKEYISKIFDISEKLQNHNVKIIYEIDIKKMDELGYNHEFIEKYVPYVVNVSIIDFKRLISLFCNDNDDVTSQDFEFLTREQYLEMFMEEQLGIKGSINISVAYPTPRRIKIFIDEVVSAMKNPEMSLKDSRKTVIAYFFVKHFFNSIFELLNFEESILDSITFQMIPEIDKQYSIIDLLIQSRKEKRRITKEDLGRMFGIIKDTQTKGFEQIVKSNMDKLGILILLGYRFKTENDKENLTERMSEKLYKNIFTDEKHICANPLLNIDEELLFNINKNEKISQLIRNLNYNSHSEYTDYEAVAKTLIENVLSAPEEEWNKKWEEFQKYCFSHNICKDNGTVFRFGENNFVSLFRAMSIYLSQSRNLKTQSIINRQDLVLKSLKFYKENDTNKGKIDFDKIVILNFCPLYSKFEFIELIKYYNSLEVIGNYNYDRIYYKFLRKYFTYAFRWGYIKNFDYFKFEVPTSLQDSKDTIVSNKKEDDDYLFYIEYTIEFLNELVEELTNKCNDMKDEEFIQNEFKEVNSFAIKCLEVMKSENYGKYTNVRIRTSSRTVTQYQNEEIYKMLQDEIENIDEHEGNYEELLQKLNSAYNNEELNYREYDTLRNLISPQS